MRAQWVCVRLCFALRGLSDDHGHLRHLPAPVKRRPFPSDERIEVAWLRTCRRLLESSMDSQRLLIPASLFGIILGLAGLSNDWREAARIWHAAAWIGEAIALLAALCWLVLMVLFARKWLLSREVALAEARHPVQCCYIALVPVTTMLMGVSVLPHARSPAIILYTVGAIGTLMFGVWKHGLLWHGERPSSSTTPVLFLPTVAGNFVSAIGAGALGWTQIGQIFFGAGLLAWLAMESVVLHRLLLAETLPPPIRPTLGIHWAPPAVGLLAFLAVTEGPPNIFAFALLGYGLLQGLVLLRLLPWIAAQPFSPGYWGFTFGASAIALGSLRLLERGATGPVEVIAPALFVMANLVIGGLALASLVSLARGKFLPAPPTAVSAIK